MSSTLRLLSNGSLSTEPIVFRHALNGNELISANLLKYSPDKLVFEQKVDPRNHLADSIAHANKS